MAGEQELTKLINDWQSGSSQAFKKLAPHIYEELRVIARSHMRRESSNQSLQATELVNEAFLKLVGIEIDYESRSHFFATATKIMRQLLVDHARARMSLKRGGKQADLTLNEQLIATPENFSQIVDLDLALTKLAARDERLANTIEYVFFGGLTYDQAAELMGVSRSAFYDDLRFAKAWLLKELG